MPHATFRDLPCMLGAVEILLAGPNASLPPAPELQVDMLARVTKKQLQVHVEVQKYEHCEVQAPTLAVALNAGLQEGGSQSWMPALEELLEAHVPTVFTGYSREDVVAGLASFEHARLHAASVRSGCSARSAS